MANWYVRPNGGAYGSENGTSWSNAFDGFSDIAWASVNAGDTVWVAGGSYTQSLVLTKSGSNNTTGRIFIRRARADASECTGASGWSSGFDSTITQTNSSIQQYVGIQYVLVSGRTTAAGGDYGWKLNCPGYTGEEYILDMDANAKYGTYEYLWLQGPGYVTYSGDSRGISASRGGNTGFVFSHIKQWGSTSGIFINGLSNTTFEWIDQADCTAVNTASWHPNGIWAAGCTGIVVRYSKFHTGPEGYACGEGIFAEQSGGNNNWKIYGNCFYDIPGGGTKCIQITSAVTNWLIYNNTFANIQNVSAVYLNGGSMGSGCEVRNSVCYLATLGGGGTMSNNITASGPGAFVNYAGRDFHIVSNIQSGYARNTGTPLAAEYATDPDGITRGGDGTWDAGAYEYDAGTTSPPTGTITLSVR